MSDKLVMGEHQSDSLKGITSFGGNDGKIVWPAWKVEFFNIVKFEIGHIGVDVLEGRMTEEMIKEGDDIERNMMLINSVMPKGRAAVVSRAGWVTKTQAGGGDPPGSSGQIVTVSIDQKVGGYNHNYLISSVVDGIKLLVIHDKCSMVGMSPDCGPFWARPVDARKRLSSREQS